MSRRAPTASNTPRDDDNAFPFHETKSLTWPALAARDDDGTLNEVRNCLARHPEGITFYDLISTHRNEFTDREKVLSAIFALVDRGEVYGEQPLRGEGFLETVRIHANRRSMALYSARHSSAADALPAGVGDALRIARGDQCSLSREFVEGMHKRSS